MSAEATEQATDDELEDAFFDPFDNSGHLQELFNKTEANERVKIEKFKKDAALQETNKQNAKKKKNKKRYVENTQVIKKGGNFQIQVHIIKATELKGLDFNGLSDPRVSVSIFDQTKTTRKINATTQPYWDQILYFDFDLEPNELTTGKCLLKVLDADRLSADDIIGYFVFDLAWIYYKKHHRIYKQFVAITNDEIIEEDNDQKEGNDEIYGKLLCSISVLGPSDEQYLDSDNEETSDRQDGLVLMPPTIIQSPYLLKVKIYKMCNLVNTDQQQLGEWIRHRVKDLFKTSSVETSDMDPFLYVEYGGTRISSGQIYQVQEADKLCIVNMEWDIPVMEPTFSKDIIVTVMEWDLLARNDRIGCVKIDYNELKNKYEVKKDKLWHIPPRWYYMYGAPPSEQRGYARKMNKGLVEGSHFRGQIYLDVTLENTKNRRSCRVMSLKKDEKKEEKQEEKEEKVEIYDENMEDYYLRCDLYEGTEINDIGLVSSGNVSVEVHVGNETAVSKTKEIGKENDFIVWNESLIHDDEEHPHHEHKNEQTKNLMGPFKIDKDWKNDKNIQLPNVYIYLCIEKIFGKNKRPIPVSYYCVPLRQILPDIDGVNSIWSRPPEWYDMKPNLALDKYKDNVFPGSLLLALNAGRLSEYIEYDTKPVPKKEVVPKPIKPKEAQYAHVIVTIISASNLPKLDMFGGGCDPYVKVLIDGKQKAETKVIKNTTNPTWNKDLLLRNVELNKQKMVLQIYDDDPIVDEFAAYSAPILLNGQKMSSHSVKLYISDKAIKSDKKNKNKCSYIKISINYKIIDKPNKDDEKSDSGVKTFFNDLFGPQQKMEMSDKGLPKQEMELRVHVYQAKNLQNMDVSGLSDAYLMVRFCGREVKTRIIDNHIDPKWYETIVLKDIMVPYDEKNENNPMEKTPRIICEIYDYDMLQKDESLGRFPQVSADIFMNDQSCKNYEKPMPVEYKLQDANGKNVQGDVLVAFELFKSTNSDIVKLPNKLIPNPVPKWMHIITLGLRDLQTSFGVIHKPFIEYEINGIVYKTEPSNVPTSRNPNFNQILAFPVELPESKDDEIFLPNLNLTIKDSICGGAIKRTLGYASQELDEYMHGQLNININMENENENKEYKQEEEPQEYKNKNDTSAYILAGDVGSVNAQKKGKKKKRKSGQRDHTEKLLQDQGADGGYSSIDIDGKEEEKQALIQKFNSVDFKMILGDSKPDDPKYLTGRDWIKGNNVSLWEEEDLNPFTKIGLMKGTNKVGEQKSSVGYFKGFIAITDNRNTLNKKYGKFFKDFGKTVELYLRVYILQGHRLAARDVTKTSASSDPYLKIKIGKTVIKTRERYIKNSLNPDFYERFEIPVKLPGASKLQISVWDYDGIGDDIIGKTEIDIEDRYYSPKYRNIAKKPIERRILRLDESGKRDLGQLDLWIELLTVQQRKITPMIEIKPPPSELYELRVIVWRCQDVKDQDVITNASDLYITGTLVSPNDDEEEQTQSTDVHLRSRNGKGSFNWRMKFPIHLPKYNGRKYPELRLQIRDQDIILANDCAGEWSLKLEKWLKHCEMYSNDNRCRLKQNDDEKIWVPNPPTLLEKLDPLGITSLKKNGKGRMQISMELVPEKEVQKFPSGLGRGEPNMNPVLPEPVGRAKFSIFHPFEALRTILGDKLLSKICCIFCCVILVAFIVLILPNLASTFLANLII